MKWGGGVFCKKIKCVGVFFCKKVDLSPQNETKLMLDLFFILHFTYLGGGRTHPAPTGLILQHCLQTSRGGFL